MPRINDIYKVPPGTDAVPNTTVPSSPYNAFVHDVEFDLNAPRPISAGGTGADNATDALKNLGATGATEKLIAGGSGLVTLVGGTTIKFVPYNGDQVKINGKIFSIPAAGVSAGFANVYVNGGISNLVAGTNYYIYLFDNAGTLTIDYSPTGHVTSATAGNVGTEIKSGDDTRSLIGFVRCSTPPTNPFYNEPKYRWVRSWFNREAERLDFANACTGQRSVASDTPLEIGNEMRCNFLNWANEEITAHFKSFVQVSTAGTLNYTVMFADAAQSLNPGISEYAGFMHTANTIGMWMPVNFSSTFSLSEGGHYISGYGWAGAGTTMYYGLAGPGVFASIVGRIEN